MKTVVVTGGRNYSDYAMMSDVLDFIKPEYLIQGGANGADALSRTWTEISNVPNTTIEAEWDIHGRKAGPLRNARMLDIAGIDAVVIAFPGGLGTENCVKQAKERNMIVLRVEK